jgi:hypothetical protein
MAIEMRDLRASVLHADASLLCVSHIVSLNVCVTHHVKINASSFDYQVDKSCEILKVCVHNIASIEKI